MVKKNQEDFSYTLMWAEKYRAKKLNEICGQDEAVGKLKQFILNFYKGKKAAILFGPSGCGKTALTYSLASALSFELFELNASDFRNRERLEATLKQALEQKSFFAKSKLLLVDEIDGLSGNRDRGGVQALTGLIETAHFPVILTANDIWQQKFNSLRQKCELIPLKEISFEQVFRLLKDIAKKEKIELQDNLIKNIASKARGDVRAAINDLQVLAADTSVESLGEREKEENIFNILRLIFKTAKVNQQIVNSLENLNMEINDVFLWFDENIPLEYKDEEIAKAYNALSIADVFRGRIHRQQHWRFLVYENAMLTAGILAAKKHIGKEYTSYKKPSRILKIWMSNQRKVNQKSICIKMAKASHISTKKAMKEFQLLRIILKGYEGLHDELKLTEEEIDFVLRA